MEQDHRFNAITLPEHGHTTPGGDTYPGYHLLVEHLFKRGTQQALLHVRMFDIDKWANLETNVMRWNEMMKQGHR